MKCCIIMADPAGNRTAIVRTPVPAEKRPETAAGIMAIPELRAEQVGFETAPLRGGEGRLEMMGGEFCGNAARSFGYLLWSERIGKIPSAVSPHAAIVPACTPAWPVQTQNTDPADGHIDIEISGSNAPLRVWCNRAADAASGIEEGISFVQMPLPKTLQYSEEGYPLVISEGITHMILQDMDPEDAFVHTMVEKYGDLYDAFGLQFIRGDRLIPVVYVAASGTLVRESSCGSGTLAAAWYLEHTREQQAKPTRSEKKTDSAKPDKTSKKSDKTSAKPDKTSEKSDKTSAKSDIISEKPDEPNKREEAGDMGEHQSAYTFREPAGILTVWLESIGTTVTKAKMGGKISLESPRIVDV